MVPPPSLYESTNAATVFQADYQTKKGKTAHNKPVQQDPSEKGGTTTIPRDARPRLVFSTHATIRATPAKKMMLSDAEVRMAIQNRELVIQPRGRIGPAGIDLRIDRDITLNPHTQKLVASIEHVELSDNLAGILHIRSSLAREAIIASLALVDPGFHGQLTVSLYNAGTKPVKLKQGERFIQLSLLKLGTPSTQGYTGQYQDSQGVVTSKRQKKSYHHRTERVIHPAHGRASRTLE